MEISLRYLLKCLLVIVVSTITVRKQRMNKNTNKFTPLCVFVHLKHPKHSKLKSDLST